MDVRCGEANSGNKIAYQEISEWFILSIMEMGDLDADKIHSW